MEQKTTFSLGRPRSALEIGRENGARGQVDLLVAPDASRLTRELIERLSDGGHVVLGDAPGAVTRAEGLGLEVMRTETQPAGRVIVARVPPKKGKLSLTVGMLSMNE